MKAQLIRLNIEVEVLSVDVIEGLVCEALKAMNGEYESGILRGNDGDEVRWDIKKKNVEIK